MLIISIYKYINPTYLFFFKILFDKKFITKYLIRNKSLIIRNIQL